MARRCEPIGGAHRPEKAPAGAFFVACAAAPAAPAAPSDPDPDPDPHCAMPLDPLLRTATMTALLLAAAPGARASALPQVQLRLAGQAIEAEVASTPAQRETGLMRRASLPAGHGMLFVFRRPQPVCMWMKDTYIPLGVAFIAGDGRIVRLADMQPLTLQAHCSGAPVRYALEMQQGWFAAHGVAPGSTLQGLAAQAGPRR